MYRSIESPRRADGVRQHFRLVDGSSAIRVQKWQMQGVNTETDQIFFLREEMRAVKHK